MSKKLLLFLCFISGGASAQFSKIYYPHINRAELAITKEHYAEASAAYREAFSNVKYPLALDLYNATVCKILLHDFDGAKPLLLKLAAKGIPPETLEKEDIFKKVATQWEAFKPIYFQIRGAFENGLPDSVQTWVNQWKNSNKGNTLKILTARTGSTTYESIALDPYEDIGARMQLERHLNATGGYGEEADGPPGEDYLLTPLNTIIFSPHLGRVLLRQKDSQLLEMAEKTLGYTPQIDAISYLLQGIETGKWHRNLYKKVMVRSEPVSIAQIRTEEDCGDEFTGYFITGQPMADTHPFAEGADLAHSKILFHFTREDHDFKLGTEQIEVNRKDFPSCRTAREEMQHWTRLPR